MTRVDMSVVIVEDHPTIRGWLERLVARSFKPLACASYEQAVQQIDALSDPPGALIVDVNLGGDVRGDGLDIARHAHARFGRRIPTLVLSGGVDPSITERAHDLRGYFLVKPQSADAVLTFLERAAIERAWGVPDVLDLDRALQRFASDHGLTQRQRGLLFVMMRAAERVERPELNPNTKKAGMRRILAKTGHRTFDELRSAIKQRAPSSQ